eukprot:1094839-Rhodomonas_salina.2
MKKYQRRSKRKRGKGVVKTRLKGVPAWQEDCTQELRIGMGLAVGLTSSDEKEVYMFTPALLAACCSKGK